MLKAFNFPPDGHDAVSQQAMLRSNVQAQVVWAPGMARTCPRPGVYDITQWTCGDGASPQADNADSQIKFCNEHGIKVILCFSCEIPEWAYAGNLKRAGHGPAQGHSFPPDDLTTNGPWATYFEAGLRRHPHCWAYVVGNEPNLGWAEYPWITQACAQMLDTAAKIAKRLKRRRLIAFGVEDGYWQVPFTEWTLHWLNRIRSLRNPLGRRWRPPHGLHVFWGWHPYSDIKTNSTARTRQALDVLARLWYAGRELACSEGGYQFSTYQAASGSWLYSDYVGDLERQAAYEAAYYRWAKGSGQVVVFAHYQYSTTGGDFGGWDSAMQDRPLEAIWNGL